MLVKKRINYSFYFIISSLMTLLLFFLSKRNAAIFWVMVLFSGVTFVYLIMLAKALEELLIVPWNMRRMDRKIIILSQGKNKVNSKRPSVQRFRRVLFKHKTRRVTASRKENNYNQNGKIKRKSFKIVALIIGKLILLSSAIGLSVQFIEDSIIFPVINYVFQIFLFAICIKRGLDRK